MKYGSWCGSQPVIAVGRGQPVRQAQPSDPEIDAICFTVSPAARPRAVTIAELLLAVVAELSSLVAIVDRAAYLLPAARFGGLSWMILAGAARRRTGRCL